MTFSLKYVCYLLSAALCLLVAACGSGGNNNSTAAPASIRFVNVDASATLSGDFNGTVQFAGQPPASAGGYATVAAGTYIVAVTGASGSLASQSFNVSLAAGQTYSLVAYVRDGAVIAVVVPETMTTPASGNASLGVANLSPDVGALDVYVVTPGTADLTGLVPTFQSATFRATTAYATLVAGTFDVVATAAGNPRDVRLRLPSVTFVGGQIETLVTTSTTGGALINATMMTVAGATQFIAASNARVRLVSALPLNVASAVTASVGAASLGPVFSPNPGAYTLVAGNASSYAVSVNGAPVAGAPLATFATGGDYTVLVYGTAAAPAVTVLTDDNQLPLVNGAVNLRLVNAGVNVAGGLTLYDNNVQVASQVGYGAASPYFGVPSANSVLELIEPSVAPVTTSVLLSPTGSVYTVFVIDATLTPYVIRDR